MPSQSYNDQIREYQNHMDQQLRSPDGWLTLVGLHWLQDGRNTIGSASSSYVQLPPYFAPQEVGELILAQGKVSLFPKPGVDVRIDQSPILLKADLESDLNRNPTIVTLGDLSFFIIIRGDRFGVRVKQVSNPLRVNFSGRAWWPIDEHYRVQAKIKRYHPKKIVDIPDVLGDLTESAMDCALEFVFNHQTYSLDAHQLPSGQFSIIFRDLSCGNGSYPAGRFLVTESPESETVQIDFNQAYNPPCAFTSYATCPLPPRQNCLDLSLPAGERYQKEYQISR